ncbi:MAG: MFS transporter [Bacillota bacterium]
MKKNETKTYTDLTTLLVMSTAYIAVFSSVQGFKAMLPLIRDDFGLSGAQAGLYSTFFYSSGVLLAVFSGRVVDAIGARKGLIGGVLIVASLMVLHTVVPTFTILLGLAVLSGIGFSVVTPSINKGIIEQVSSDKRAVSNGIVHAGGGIGGVLGASLLPFIGERFGWRLGILISAGLAFLMAVLLFQMFYPRNNNGTHEETSRSFKEDLAMVVKNPLVWMVTLVGISVGLSLGNVTIHYTLFLTGDLAYSPTLAGIALSLFMVGGIIGNPLFGYVNDRFLNSNRRHSLFTLLLVLAGLFFYLGNVMIESDMPFILVAVSTLVLGMVAFASMGMMFTTLGDVAGPRLMGTATGFMLVFIRLSVVITPPLLGYLADVSGNYRLSWTVIAFSLVGLSTLFFILTRSHKHLLRREESTYQAPYHS